MSPRSPSPRVAVIGAGITGLTAAWHLRRAGVQIVLLEKNTRVGGAIGVSSADGWLHELGPNSLMEGAPAVTELVEQTGLASRRLYASKAARQRYIVRDGEPVAMPTSPLGFVGTRLFSPWAKFKLLGEPWRARGAADREESVADFVVRRLGREFLDYAINPFVGGVYAGDPRGLSVRHAFPKLHAIEQQHGSLIRGALKQRNTSGGPKGRIFSFPNGLIELPATLARSMVEDMRLRTTILAIRRVEDGWEIDCQEGELTWMERCDAIVSAVPADALAGLPFTNVPAAAALSMLREIPHPPVASVFTGYRREDVCHALDGFGVLIPEVEKKSMLGTLFSSTLFPGRAPEGHVALTSFVGGMRQPDLTELGEVDLLRTVQRDLAALLGVHRDPVYVHIQRWPRAIPQYRLGYQRFKNAIQAAEAAAPGLFIGGNARDGISLANCIESGRRLATTAQQFVASLPRPRTPDAATDSVSL